MRQPAGYFQVYYVPCRVPYRAILAFKSKDEIHHRRLGTNKNHLPFSEDATSSIVSSLEVPAGAAVHHILSGDAKKGSASFGTCGS
jgi:hypothetical protein